jgi:hypothetical protein
VSAFHSIRDLAKWLHLTGLAVTGSQVETIMNPNAVVELDEPYAGSAAAMRAGLGRVQFEFGVAGGAFI